MNKKRPVNTFRCVIYLLFISVVLGVAVWVGYNLFIMYSTEPIICEEINCYKNAEFTKYDGGEIAKEFLPEYKEVEKNNIKFSYADSRPKDNCFHKYCSSFVLDVYYTSDTYDLYKNEHNSELYDRSYNGYEILFEEKKENCWSAVFCNDEYFKVRYIFLYGDILNEAVSGTSLIPWNTGCDW